MLFNSLIFFGFAAVFFAFWPLAQRWRSFGWLYLSAASFVFYGWWDARFLILILASGLLDFFVGLGIQRYPARKRLLLFVSVAGNIGSLATFKYAAFIAENLGQFLVTLGLGSQHHFEAQLPELLMVLPVGISFYTFQSMSYTIDIYRGQLQPTRNVFHFFAYLSMFPQLVAGPIVRAKDLLPQLERPTKPSETERWEGLRRLAHGYFKKVVLADNLAPLVNEAFAAVDPNPSSLYWWLVITAFAFQIYCDFSGYSDIAIGLARWMGFRFDENFSHPYGSISLREFWSRWHISLSSWFRDYVYIPLGGSRLGAFGAHRNMWITMLLSGLWHGAAWTFVMWGALHALFLSIERITRWPNRLQSLPGGRWICAAVVVVQVWVAWVFFRAQSFEQAVEITKLLFSFSGGFINTVEFEDATLILLIAGLREIYLFAGCNRLLDQMPRLRSIVDPLVVGLLLIACVFLRGPGGAFIYFQF